MILLLLITISAVGITIFTLTQDHSQPTLHRITLLSRWTAMPIRWKKPMKASWKPKRAAAL